MRKPKRIIVTERVLSDIEDGSSLTALIADATDIVKKYSNIRFEFEYVDYEGIESIHLIGDRLENDKEYNRRVAKILKKIEKEKSKIEKEKGKVVLPESRLKQV